MSLHFSTSFRRETERAAQQHALSVSSGGRAADIGEVQMLHGTGFGAGAGGGGGGSYGSASGTNLRSKYVKNRSPYLPVPPRREIGA